MVLVCLFSLDAGGAICQESEGIALSLSTSPGERLYQVVGVFFGILSSDGDTQAALRQIRGKPYRGQNVRGFQARR